MSSYEDALLIAVRAHAGQTRKISGDPYVVHPIRVAKIAMRIAREWGMGDDMINDIRIAAVLHDVVEDAPAFWDEITKTFSQNIQFIVAGMTRSDGWTYADYIDSFKTKRVEAIVIKLADLEDNLSDLPADHSLRKRYEKAQEKLRKTLKKSWTE